MEGGSKGKDHAGWLCAGKADLEEILYRMMCMERGVTGVQGWEARGILEAPPRCYRVIVLGTTGRSRSVIDGNSVH